MRFHNRAIGQGAHRVPFALEQGRPVSLDLKAGMAKLAGRYQVAACGQAAPLANSVRRPSITGRHDSLIHVFGGRRGI
jgi:hypothetical protein